MKSPFNLFYISIIKKIGILLLFITLAYACVESNPTLTTFKGDMIYSYLKKDTVYSEYVKLIDKAGFRGMLSAYGSYTCLAPTNHAFKLYYKSLGKKFNIDSLTKKEVEYIAKTHLIGTTFKIENLQNGVIPNTNMNQRFIEVKFTNDPLMNTLKIMLNDSSQIISKDNEVYNGVVQGIDRVLQPSVALLPELLDGNEKLSIFSKALKITHLDDSLRIIKDMSYIPVQGYKDEYDVYLIPSPAERKYGFTLLVEDNDVLKANGITNIDELKAKANELYPSGKGYENDYTNRNNSLNQFISYHIIEKTIYLNKFLYTSHATKNANVYEFLESKLTNKIMKVSNTSTGSSTGIIINPDSNNPVHVKEIGSKTTLNGVYHLIDNMLLYTEDVEKMLQNTRIRFDVNSLFPELTNNGLRCARALKMEDGDRYGIPQGYSKNLKSSKDTRIIYLAGQDESTWTSYQGDELMGLGSYDITIRLLPIPPGTYELRYGYSANPYRSVTQIYIDNKPIGIPLDLKTTADDAKIGWMLDESTDDGGYENDKMMRNRGYMKGPTSFCVYFSKTPTPARYVKGALRRIIGTFTFTDYGEHYIRLKSVTNNPTAQLDLDFFEFVPKSIYNPIDGEPEARD